jgi:hypothetical protein
VKRHASTIVLVVAALGLSLLLLLERDKVSEGERQRRENYVFVAWRKDDLARVEIAHEGETIVLERQPKADSAWRMTSPRQERVDQAAAERLLTTLEFATISRKLGDPSSGADDTTLLKLDAPRATGSVAMGSLVIHFALGGASPRPEGSSYFRVDDGAPFVVSKELTQALLASSDTYRDRTVVPYLSLDLSRFEVKHPGGGFVVERSDARSFKVQGLGVLAARSALDKVWGALAEIRAEAFPKDADAERLTASPRLTILMTPKEPAMPPGELVVGDGCPGHPEDVVVLRKQPARVAACAPKGAIDALLAVTPPALVDRLPFGFRHDEVEEIRLERIGGADAGAAPPAIELARRGTGFHERAPADRELSAEEADAVSELLTHIEHGAADEVRPGGGPFAAVARAKVRSGEYEETVEIGAPSAGARTVPLRRVRDDARLEVAPAIARRLVPRATTLRGRALLSEARPVKRVVLRCGAAQELVDDGAGLKLVEPAGYETDGSIVQLVSGIVKGKVLAWVADADDGSFGLAADSCRVVLSFADGNAPVTLRFGAEGEGGVYGIVDGHPEIFVAPPSLYELAKRIYVSHAALRAEPSRVDSVKVTAHGKAVVIHDSAALREATGKLFADRVVAVGSSDVGPVELEITITLAEGGPPKRVVCGPMVEHWRRCAASGVRAVFDVHPSALGPFFAGGEREPADAGASSRDAAAGAALRDAAAR